MTRTASASDLTPGDVTLSATVTVPAHKRPPRRAQPEPERTVALRKLLEAKNCAVRTLVS